MSKILIIDGYNMIHRCRFQRGGGFAEGEFAIVYNFFRTLRSLVGEFSPDIVYFPIDGKPAKRLEKSSSYKANRKVDTEDPDVVLYWESFRRQKNIILSFVRDAYPIRTAYHPNHEADDLVPHIISEFHPDDSIVVVSSDTDFIQLLSDSEKIKLYNPISKEYRKATEYDYVSWKAMVGDRSDNIPGVRGIGKVKAESILRKDGELEQRLLDPSFKKSYTHSYGLIKFLDLSEDKDDIFYTKANLDTESITQSFEEMGFSSLLKEEYLENYFDTFSGLG